MDSNKKENIRQDLQDYSAKRAFGPRGISPEAKKIFIPLNFEEQGSVFNQGQSSCKSCPKNKIKIESIQHFVALCGKILGRIGFR